MDHSTSTNTFADIMSARTRDRQHRPLLTVYDDTVGTRTELSYATVDNWAAKSANLLVEELELGPGATVALDLDGHWTTAAMTLACWKAGIAVTRQADGVDLVCCHTARLSAHDTGPVLVVGDGLRAEPVEPVAQRAGLVLLGEDVHTFADDYDGADVRPTTPALVAGGATVDHAGVVRRAQRWRVALGDGARVGLAGALDDAPLLLAGVVAAGGSIVAARPPTTAPPWGRWETERVTVAAGTRGALSDPPDGVTTVELTAADDA
jgi:uncharacterized protein (TIGR03089 family)